MQKWKRYIYLQSLSSDVTPTWLNGDENFFFSFSCDLHVDNLKSVRW